MMNTTTLERFVVIGATSVIAEHCARLWVGRAAIDIILVARDIRKLEAVAADLRVRNPLATIRVASIDFTDAAAISTLIEEAASAGPIDVALVAHGSLPDQTDCETDLSVNRDALLINAVSPALFAEAFVRVMQRAGRGRLAVIGSVAGDRGRKSNYVYGSAKGMVERYVQGLQHRLANSPVTVTLVKPGPTDTPMTASMKQRGAKLATPDEVAKAIVTGTGAGSPIVYTPRKWALIMMVIRHLPRFVFNKLDI